MICSTIQQKASYFIFNKTRLEICIYDVTLDNENNLKNDKNV